MERNPQNACDYTELTVSEALNGEAGGDVDNAGSMLSIDLKSQAHKFFRILLIK